MSELAGIETELGQAAVEIQSLAMAGTITAGVEKILLAALGNGQPPAEHSDRAQALAALQLARDTPAGECAVTVALVGIGHALLAVEARIGTLLELAEDEYDDYRGIETVDTKGLT